MSLMCYQASVAGTSHLALGVSNQDSFAVRHMRGGWSGACVGPHGTWAHPIHVGEFVVAAVADGLGSAEFSDIGSAIAAATAADTLAFFVAMYPDLGDIDTLTLEGVMHRALVAVERKAAELDADPAALATTLALCAWDGSTVAWACAGDSGIVGLFGDGYRPLCRMARNGHRNVVFPLSADDRWQFGTAEGVEGLVLATDGILEQLVPGLVGSAPDAPADSDAPADPEVNERLLDLFLRLDPVDAARPKDLSVAAQRFLGDLDPIDVYDDKTVVVLYDAPDSADASYDPDRFAAKKDLGDEAPFDDDLVVTPAAGEAAGKLASPAADEPDPASAAPAPAARVAGAIDRAVPVVDPAALVVDPDGHVGRAERPSSLRANVPRVLDHLPKMGCQLCRHPR